MRQEVGSREGGVHRRRRTWRRRGGGRRRRRGASLSLTAAAAAARPHSNQVSTGRRGGGRCPSRGLVAAARAATGLETWKRALHHVRTREHLRTPWDGVDTNNCSRILNSKAAFFFMARSRCTYPAINHRVNPLLAVN